MSAQNFGVEEDGYTFRRYRPFKVQTLAAKD